MFGIFVTNLSEKDTPQIQLIRKVSIFVPNTNKPLKVDQYRLCLMFILFSVLIPIHYTILKKRSIHSKNIKKTEHCKLGAPQPVVRRSFLEF